MRKFRQQWGELSFEKKLGIVVVPVLLAIISGVVVPILNRGTEKLNSNSPRSSSPESKLEIVDLAVSGGVIPRCLGDPVNLQKVDLTVRNIGDIPALVKRLVFRVRNFGFIEIPQKGSGLDPSTNYDVLLPPHPRIGQTLTYKVSQQVPARSLDRFTVRLDVPTSVRLDGYSIYQLDVMLLHDTGTKPTDAGKVLVAARYVPGKEMFLAGVAPRYRSSFEESGPGQTMKENERVFRRMFKLAGERSPELKLDLVDVPITNKEADTNPCALAPSGSG
jgi:hypothetical protein